jgi:biotin carboxyl carrier protein
VTTPQPAKVVNMRIRPCRWTSLSFNVGGILETVKAQLGTSATRFDYPGFYDQLLTPVGGNPARLQFDAQAIRTDSKVQASTLCALRAEPTKAILNKAVGARENMFYSNFQNQTEIIARIREINSPTTPHSKPHRLHELATISQNQAELLYSAYFADGRLAVVKSTISELRSKTDSKGESCTTTIGDGFVSSASRSLEDGSSNIISDAITGDSTAGSVPGGSTSSVSNDVSFGVNVGTSLTSSFDTGFSAQNSLSLGHTESKGQADQIQKVVNTDYGYRVPHLESAAQNQRAQISLMDERFAQYMSNQNLPNLEHVFHNNKQAMDLDVKRLQVAYLDTILMSPIDGIVTGVFKNPGDWVKAGEPIVRIEDNSDIYLVGTVVFRGPIIVNTSNISVSTTLFSVPGAPWTTITGTVVGTRGQRAEDDRWDVIIKCKNPLDGSGNPIFPLHYFFDYDDTTATVS